MAALNFFNANMPLPGGNMDTKPFWDFCDKHELRIQVCNDCKNYWHTPTPCCYKCHSFNFTWTEVSGKATVYSKLIVHRAPHPAVADKVPYNIVMVTLDDYPEIRLSTNVVDCPNEEIKEGMPVELVWDDVAEGRALYRFKRR